MKTFEIFFKEDIQSPKINKVLNLIKKKFNIEIKNYQYSTLYHIDYDISNDKLEQFAKILYDPLIENYKIDQIVPLKGYKSYISEQKYQHVTDDDAKIAQYVLSFIDEKIPNKRVIYIEKIHFFDISLDNNTLLNIAKDIIGNPIINSFNYGLIDKNFTYFKPIISNDKDNFKTELIDILNMDHKKLLKLSKDRVLSLNIYEMDAIKKYYSDNNIIEKRKKRGISLKATDCEIEIFAQTWSEHCKHKEFNALINYKDEESGKITVIDSLFKTYIEKSTHIIEQKLKKAGNNWLIKVFSDNAGVVQFNKDKLFVWKVETHNSPSALDPYGGAITGILGNNRDPLGTGKGGGELLFNTDVLCFPPLDSKKRIYKEQLTPEQIYSGVRAGIEDGGNLSGIPTINGSTIFHNGYRAKPLVYCGTGGIMDKFYNGEKSWEKNSYCGDFIIMAGGRVGKDGIHGATFSSVELDKDSPISAVQIGSPFTQKKLYKFIRKIAKNGLINGITDNGAGGLSSSIGEMATITGGATVYLEKVPLKYRKLAPWEILLSESQERMTLSISPKNFSKVKYYADLFDVEISNIGNFTNSGYFEVLYKNDIIAYLNLDFLHNKTPKKNMIATWKVIETNDHLPIENIDHKEIIKKLLNSWNICSKEGIVRQYDHEVKGKTILKPFMGNSPQDCGVIKVDHFSDEAIAVASGIAPKFGELDPYTMSESAFDEAVRSIISIGGKLPLKSNNYNPFWSVNDNFCVPNSDYNEKNNRDGDIKLGKLVKMCEALFDYSTFFNIPMTSGKDSMKNDFISSNGDKLSIPPTILYSVTSKIDDIKKIVTTNFKQSGSLIYQMGETYRELGRSEYYNLLKIDKGYPPKVRKDRAKDLYIKMMELNDQNILLSSHDISDGGMIITILESIFGTKFGIDIRLDNFNIDQIETILYSESNSRFIVSIDPKDRDKFEEITKERAIYLGKVTKNQIVKIKKGKKVILNCKLSELYNCWIREIEQL